MRLDKFLKVSRLIKRRTMAKEVADQGRIMINGKEAKAGSVIKVGDELVLRFGGSRIITVRVDQVQESAKKAESAEMFTILKDERIKMELEGE